MILVIDNYDSFTWNLVHYLQQLGADVEVVRNDAMSAGQAISSGAQGFLISPGPCTPTEAGISLELVGACAKAGKPLFGVCLGHQSIGQYFGGRVVRARELMHGKTSLVTHDGTGVFAGIPSPFTAIKLPRSSIAVTRIGTPYLSRSRSPSEIPSMLVGVVSAACNCARRTGRSS